MYGDAECDVVKVIMTNAEGLLRYDIDSDSMIPMTVEDFISLVERSLDWSFYG